MAELPQPDMSHLTPEERRIIEGVLMRQKEEEEQDHEIMRYVLPMLGFRKSLGYLYEYENISFLRTFFLLENLFIRKLSRGRVNFICIMILQ